MYAGTAAERVGMRGAQEGRTASSWDAGTAAGSSPCDFRGHPDAASAPSHLYAIAHSWGAAAAGGSAGGAEGLNVAGSEIPRALKNLAA